MTKTSWNEYYKNLEKNPRVKKRLDHADKAIDISMQIIELREKRSLTQKELAGLVKVSQPAIARLESADYKRYSLKTLNKIATALDAIIKVSFVTKEEPSTHYISFFSYSDTSLISSGNFKLGVAFGVNRQIGLDFRSSEDEVLSSDFGTARENINNISKTNEAGEYTIRGAVL